MSPSPGAPPPFLQDSPPIWAARALSTVLLALFVVAVVALFVVRVPETVAANFVLTPVRDADPIRALHPGIVSQVNVVEAQVVRQHDVLFVVASELVGDRVSERRMIDARLAGGNNRQANEKTKYENQQRADAIKARIKGQGVDESAIQTVARGQLDATGPDGQPFDKDRYVEITVR